MEWGLKWSCALSPYEGQEVQWEEIAWLQALAFPQGQTLARTLYPNKRLQDTYLYSSKHLLLTSYDRLKTKLKKCSFCNYASTIRCKRRTARWQVEKTTIMF